MHLFFFFTDTATPEIYTLSLHDALPICRGPPRAQHGRGARRLQGGRADARGVRGAPPRDRLPRRRLQARAPHGGEDRKSTRLNSSHMSISYAVFCLKKKKKKNKTYILIK